VLAPCVYGDKRVPALSLNDNGLPRACRVARARLAQPRETNAQSHRDRGVTDLTDRSRSLRDFRGDGDAQGCKHGRRATARGPTRRGTTVGAMSLVQPASQA
jgi:hypothetical protein